VILHLVTDRLRLAGAAASMTEAQQCLLQQIDYAIEARIDVVQIRERDLDGRQLAALVRAALDRARGSTTRILVNERADVAVACGAGGVHLRASSMPASAVRRLVPASGAAGGFLIGRSVHGLADAVAAAAGCDYLIAGTVWPTVSKPEDHPLLGLDGLAAVAAAVAIPVLAIGGVTSEHASMLTRAGAAGVAGIGLFMGPAGGGCGSVPLTGLVTTLKSTAT
jgi:thiamine-phosphate pyrophosphorylase